MGYPVSEKGERLITGSIQLKKNKWYIVYRDNGKQKWKSTGISIGKNKQEQKRNKNLALDYKTRFFDELKKSEAKIASEKNVIQNAILVTEYFRFWLIEIKPTIKPSTFEGYEKMTMTNIIPYFRKNYQELEINQLSALHITRFFIFLSESGKKNKKGFSKKSVLNIRGIMSSALAFAVDCRLIETNPVKHARMPLSFGESEKPKTTIYTKEQVKNLLEYAESTNSKAQIFLYLTAFSGCRRGEIMGLTWDHVDFEHNLIHICQNRVGSRKENLTILTSPKTKSSIRSLSLPPKVMQILIDEKVKQDINREKMKNLYHEYPDDYVIRQDDGKIYNPNSMNRIVNKLMKRANLPHCRIHDIRHFVATILFESDVPVNQITAQLGHASTSITEQIYVHRNNSNTSIASNTLATAIGMV